MRSRLTSQGQCKIAYGEPNFMSNIYDVLFVQYHTDNVMVYHTLMQWILRPRILEAWYCISQDGHIQPGRYNERASDWM
jgi:hypothetical protein